jgi:hypothetical protein
MIVVQQAKNGELYYSGKGRNGKKISSNETFKRKAGIRTNIKANLKFWGGTQMEVIWPDGSRELIKLDFAGSNTASFHT